MVNPVFKPVFYIFSYNEQLRKILKNFMDKFLLYHTSLSILFEISNKSYQGDFPKVVGLKQSTKGAVSTSFQKPPLHSSLSTKVQKICNALVNCFNY